MWWIIGWFACSIAGYLLIRHATKKARGGEWTCGERNLLIILSVLLGPAMVISALLILLFISDKPAKW